MAAPLLPSFFTHIVYPAVLTSLGVLGNYYVLGGRITAWSKELEDEIKKLRNDVRGDVKEIRGDVKEIRNEMKDLQTRQTRLMHSMSVTEKILEDCAGNK